MIRVAKLGVAGPLAFDEREVRGVISEILVTWIKVLSRVRTDLRSYSTIKYGIDDLRSNLIVNLARKLKRIQSVLGEPIDDLIVEVVGAGAVQCNAAERE